MTVYRVLHSRLTCFWRNLNISSIFYLSKSTSINTQYSTLWDTLKMLLFTKYLIKWKCIGRISWKLQYWFNFKILYRIRYKQIHCRCYTCPKPKLLIKEKYYISTTCTQQHWTPDYSARKELKREVGLLLVASYHTRATVPPECFRV